MKRKRCPYIDTVDRKSLSLDFVKYCSVTGDNFNLYCCLVCGKCFKGRAAGTPAYLHSISASHFMFYSLEHRTFHCLPDDYEVVDGALDDIREAWTPSFTLDSLRRLDERREEVQTRAGARFYAGYLGVVDGGAAGGLGAALLLLSHIPLVRRALLLPQGDEKAGSISGIGSGIGSGLGPSGGARRPALAAALREAARRLWHGGFRGTVEPDVLARTLETAAPAAFPRGRRLDPLQALLFLLRHGGETVKRAAASAVRGRLVREEVDAEGRAVAQETETPFHALTLDLPAELALRANEESVLSQVPLSELLAKFDGEALSPAPSPKNTFMRYRLTQCPRFLLLHVQRIRELEKFSEVDPTVVMHSLEPTDLAPSLRWPHGPLVYRPIASVVFEGDAKHGHYRTLLRHRANGKWIDCSPRGEANIILPELVSLCPFSLLMLELQDDHDDHDHDEDDEDGGKEKK